MHQPFATPDVRLEGTELMPTPWKDLCKSLDRELRSPPSAAAYRRLQALQPALEVADSPPGLVEFLRWGADRQAEKNDVLRALVSAHQAGGPDAEVASLLLWDGLKPGLGRTLRRLQVRQRCDEAEALSALAIVFTEQLATLDLTRVRRVAATVLRNVGRDCGRQYRDELEEQQRFAPEPEIERAIDPRHSCTLVGAFAVAANDNAIPEPTPPPEPTVRELVRRLVEVVGPVDAELIVSTVLHAETQKAAGARLGLSHEVARKRIQRALTRARPAFRDLASHSAAATAFRRSEEPDADEARDEAATAPRTRRRAG